MGGASSLWVGLSLAIRCVLLQAIRKLSKKVKAYSRPSADSAASHVLLEHKNEVKGACLEEGQVRVHQVQVLSM